LNQEIPEDWIKVKFKELAKQRSVRVDDPGESGYEKYVGLEHLDSGELVVKRYGSTSDVTSTMKLFEKDDILFARRNTYLRRVSVAPFDGVCSGDIIVLEPILKHIVKDFLPIFMQFEPFENRIIALSAGAFSKRIKWNQLAEEEIFIPSIKEQKKIVEAVWSIQNNLDKTYKLIEITELFKRGILNKLVTKGINHINFKDSKLGQIPNHWDIKSLGEAAYIKARIGWKGLKSSEYTSDGPYLIAAKHIINDKIDWENADHLSDYRYDESPEIQLKIGDIILSKDGTIGRVAFVDYLPDKTTINSTMMLIRPDSNLFIHKFVYFYLQADIFQNLIKEKMAGSTIAHIFQKDMKNLYIPVIPFNEQEKIIEILNGFDNQLEKLRINSDALTLLKKEVTNSLLSGNLKIPLEALQNVQ
jgi:type I restriction enzyme S subunit